MSNYEFCSNVEQNVVKYDKENIISLDNFNLFLCTHIILNNITAIHLFDCISIYV